MIQRWLPSPWLSLGIFGGWLLLNQSLSAAQVLLAAIVAVCAPLLMSSLRPVPGPLRHWGVLAMLILRVGCDVVTSALDVALSLIHI